MKNDWGFENNTGAWLCFAEEGYLRGLGSRIFKDALPKLNISPEKNIIRSLFDLGQVSTTPVTITRVWFPKLNCMIDIFLKGEQAKDVK